MLQVWTGRALRERVYRVLYGSAASRASKRTPDNHTR